MKMMRFLAAALAVAGLWAQPVAAQGIPKSVLPAICGTATVTSATICVNDGNGVEVPIGSLNPAAHTWTPLGTPLTITFGTTAGTSAQGNDSRITGALQTSNALSELAGVSSAARANISAAARGTNGDITSLSGLTTPLSAAQGGTGGTSFSSGLDASFGSLQGSMLYRNASGWVVLLPGTSGQLLSTGGSAANPSWISANGTGTVTSIAATVPSDETVTGSPVTTNGTLAITRNAQAPNQVLAGPASGSSAVPAYRALVPADDPAPADGCVRLSVTSTTTLTLSPYGCNTLWINGAPTVVTPITISNSGLPNSTLYYVYDTTSGLVLSQLGHITGSDGREYLNSGGSPSTIARLVGMIETNASGQFQDAVTFRGCLNWFNRRGLALQASTTNAAIGNTSPFYLSNSTFLFLSWGNEAYQGNIEGWTTNNTSGDVTYVSYAIDNAGVGFTQLFQTYAANAYGSLGIGYATSALSEGAHTATAAAYVNGGAANISLFHTAMIRG